MRFNAPAVLTGLNSSKGEYEGRAFDSTTFHLQVDLPEKTTGESMGAVTRPFKLGSSTEFAKWKNFKNNWPLGGVAVECVFEVTAGAENSSKIVLVDIKPAPAAAKG